MIEQPQSLPRAEVEVREPRRVRRVTFLAVLAVVLASSAAGVALASPGRNAVRIEIGYPASSPLAGSSPWFEGPTPIVASLTTNDDCIQYFEGFACVRPVLVRSHAVVDPRWHYTYVYPGTIVFEVRNTSTRVLDGRLTARNTNIGIATSSDGITGVDPVAFVARGPGRCSGAPGTWSVPPESERRICVNFALGSPDELGNTARANRVYDVVFSGLAAWALPVARTGMSNFNLVSPAQDAVGDNTGYAGAVTFDGYVPTSPSGPSPYVHELVAPLPTIAPWAGWSMGWRGEPPAGPLVFRFAIPKQLGSTRSVRILAPFADASFACSRRGCSIARVHAYALPASIPVSGCTRNSICYVVPIPFWTHLVAFSFVLRTPSGQQLQITQATPTAATVEAASLR